MKAWSSLATLLLVVLSAPGLAGDLKSQVVNGQDNNPRQCFNVVIVGDGWKEEDSAKYTETADKLIGKLMAIKPLDGYKRLFRFTRVDAWSEDHGISIDSPPCCKQLFDLLVKKGAKIDIPRHSLEHNTHFGCRMALRDERCCTVDKPITQLSSDEQLKRLHCCNSAEGSLSIPAEGVAKIQSEIVQDMVPDVVMLITPDDDFHAACATRPDRPEGVPPGLNFTMILMTLYNLDHDLDAIAYTFAHEIGHAIFKLGDEYSTDPTGCNKPPFDYGDPANLTLDPKRPKWQYLIDWGIVPKDPVIGGGMACKTSVWHPTATCRMDEAKENFCPVCLERIAHGAGERSSLIKESSPGGRSVEAKSNDTLKFWVTTMPMEDQFGEYGYNWTLDAKSINAGTIKFPQKSYFEVSVGPLPVGLHTLSFEVQDRRRASTEPGAIITARLPVCTRYWTVQVRSECAFWKFGCEAPQKLEDEFIK